MKEAKMLKCCCGRKPELITEEWEGNYVFKNIYYVKCPRTDKEERLICWSGPVKTRKEDAIFAWNKLMRRF